MCHAPEQGAEGGRLRSFATRLVTTQTTLTGGVDAKVRGVGRKRP